MSRRHASFTHSKQRSVLTDMLPYEVPATFSNRGFYRFLRQYEVEIADGKISWVADDDRADIAILLLIGASVMTDPLITQETKSGIVRSRRSVKMEKNPTLPFNFYISHRSDGRMLSVVHPKNQVEVAAFYSQYASSLVYYSSLSDFSIRKPVSVSRSSYFKDKLHEQRFERSAKGIEEEGSEYKQFGSYFVYKKYRNIHKFFESSEYHKCERKYEAMIQIDIARCFDSIYTHSVVWSILGKHQAKFNIDASKTTFAGRFDKLMQSLNHDETNGIVIGPEFSRIFAELILQSVDVAAKRRLKNDYGLIHKVNYEIFRYVDDYFIFYNKESEKDTVVSTLEFFLKEKKMSMNSSKMKVYEKPIITEITIAKELVAELISHYINPVVELVNPNDPDSGKFVCAVDSRKLIVGFKTVLKQTGVAYGDIMNYALTILESRFEGMYKAYVKCDLSLENQKRLIKAVLGSLEFAFFAYLASPRVNHTIRMCRLLVNLVQFVSNERFSYDFRHLIMKFIHDRIVHQLRKNPAERYREIETLYLLLSLSQLGKEYWLPESALVAYFSIDIESPSYKRKSGYDYLDYFSITVILSYVRNKVRYTNLRKFIEGHIIEKMKHSSPFLPFHTESTILFFDLVSCPYISKGIKEDMARLFNLDGALLAKFEQVNKQWFTAWGDDFNLVRELDAKRSREVY